jgi:outer membrane protein assembly factor BamB
MTGRRVWSRTLPLPKILYGYASSLLLHEDRLIVQFFTNDHHSIYALDAATGEIVWENSDGEPDGRRIQAAWSSPVVAFDREGRPVVVVTGGNAVEAYDFGTGRRLWANSCLWGEVASAPAVAEERGLILFAHIGVGAGALDIATGETVWLNEDVLLPDTASPLAADDFLYIATSSGFVTCLSLSDGEFVWEHETRGGYYASPVRAGDGSVLVLDDRGC